MPIPILIGAVGAIAAAVDVAASAYSAWLAAGVINEYKREILAAVESALTLNMGPLATDFANARLSEAGIELAFRDISDLSLVAEDVDAFVTGLVNDKAGTGFESIKDLTQEQFLSEAGDLISAKISEEAGIDIVVWPPADFIDSVGDAVIAQIENGGGSLIPADVLALIEEKIIERLGITLDEDGNYTPAELIRKRLLGAARQRKYRSTTKKGCTC